jgi:hypothetical protein
MVSNIFRIGQAIFLATETKVRLSSPGGESLEKDADRVYQRIFTLVYKDLLQTDTASIRPSSRLYWYTRNS